MPKAQLSPVEKRIAKFSRQCARIINELRSEGDHEAARRMEAVAIAIVENKRAAAREHARAAPATTHEGGQVIDLMDYLKRNLGLPVKRETDRARRWERSGITFEALERGDGDLDDRAGK